MRRGIVVIPTYNEAENFPLLVPRVRANYTDDPLANNDLAIPADLLDRRSNFHSKTPYLTDPARP